MKVYLHAIEPALADAWERHVTGNGLIKTQVVRSSILETHAQAIVSPANSFGVMDGGIDLVYLRKFGDVLQQRLQHTIEGPWRGELHVGSATMICLPPGGLANYLIAAPTMRQPMRLPSDTINPYLATRAALILAMHNDLDSIAFPGMGTGIGRVPPDECARQMHAAIESVAGNGVPEVKVRA